MMDYGNKKLKIMKKIMKILLKNLRSIPLPIVRDQDVIKAPKPFCRDLMPYEKTRRPQQKKLRKGYENRTRNK
jgi:hypothetical protein